jgi:hypothetical protein
VPLAEPRRRSLRDAVIRLFEDRLPEGRLGPQEGIWSRQHMDDQLAKLRAGETVQLQRYGELNALPTEYRPASSETWSLAELRNDDLVPVPPWRTEMPRPREWTI